MPTDQGKTARARTQGKAGTPASSSALRDQLQVLVIHRRGCRVIAEDISPAWYVPTTALAYDPEHGQLLQVRCNDPACPAIAGVPLQVLQDQLLTVAESLDVPEVEPDADEHLRTDTCVGCSRDIRWNGYGWVSTVTGVECEATSDGLHHGTSDDELLPAVTGGE